MEELHGEAPEAEQLARRLMAYNEARACAYDFAALRLVERDAHGEIIAGAIATTGWSWLQIEVMWVDAADRKRGLGRRLVAELERLAKQRGCVGAFLDTFDFQARGFYERCGYQVYGSLAGQPPGHTRYWLSKHL